MLCRGQYITQHLVIDANPIPSGPNLSFKLLLFLTLILNIFV